MLKYVVRWSLLMVALLMIGWGAGCASSKESGDESSDTRSRRARSGAAAQYGELNLATPSPDVHTIQLYPTQGQRPDVPAEAELPVLALDSRQTLTLEFDLVRRQGGALSAYFYHANRTWRRDLTPSEYLTSFQRDNLIDYSPSQGTQVDYVHYRYAFPNESIDFLISGNYIVRVTEQGREDQVIFERAFFVTERQSSLEMTTDRITMAGQSYPSVQPIVRFRPPSSLASNVFDYNVCFVENGRIDQARCTDRPQLNEQPYLRFFLQPERAFDPQSADYFLDLNNLRVGQQIESTDFSTTPYSVILEPDYARFPGSGLDPLLNGQPVTSTVRDVADPDIAGEYVNVTFRFVPPNEQPIANGIVVMGSFNGWRFEPANALTWSGARGRYEGTLLIKQGQYEYRYASRDGRLRRELQGNLPRRDNAYVALVYYSDVSLNTDRLLAFGGIGSTLQN